MSRIKSTLKPLGVNGRAEHQEQGSVLIYALMIITFLSGLAAYLQTMSDPMIFQTKDSQQILSTEYLADSLENIIPELCEGDGDFAKADPNSVNRDLVAKVVNKYPSIYIYRKQDLLIGEAKIKSDATQSCFEDPFVSADGAVVTRGKVEYSVQYFNTVKATKEITLIIEK